MKSGKVIFNLDKSFSEYKNNINKIQYLSEKPTSSLTAENEEDEDPFEKEFFNSVLENEENIFEENKDELTIARGYEEDQDEFKKSNCSCALCKCMNNVYERWEKWEPTSMYEELLKTHIDEMN